MKMAALILKFCRLRSYEKALNELQINILYICATNKRRMKCGFFSKKILEKEKIILSLRSESQKALTDGVTAALQILVLPV